MCLVVLFRAAYRILMWDNGCEAKCDWTGKTMITIYRILLVSALAALATQASAQSLDGSRYEMVTVPANQNNSMMTAIPNYQNQPTDKVIFLDKRTGQFWSWSDSTATISYLGQILPIAGARPFARIIHVNPEENGK